MEARRVVPCTQDDLYDFLTEQALAPLKQALSSAGSRQRLRVTTLPTPVMCRLCARLAGDPRWVARLLVKAAPAAPWEATATKLIELRNGLPEPLLVFAPPGLHSAAEDSLDIATFTELSLASLGADVVKALFERVPDAIKDPLGQVLGYLRQQKLIRNNDQEADYLLTLAKNGHAPWAVGACLFIFSLIPDFELIARGRLVAWLSRNVAARKELADLRQPVRSRIARLKLEPDTIQPALFRFLRDRASEDVAAWGRVIACDPAAGSLSFDHWRFAEAGQADELRLLIAPLSLPVQKHDEIGDAVRMPVLDLNQGNGLKVSFRSLPAPAQVDAWTTFRIQVLSFEGEQPTVAWESNGYPKPTGKKTALITRTIKTEELKKRLDEGAYFVRVEAYDKDGTVITTHRKLDPAKPDSRMENESGLFLVTRDKTATTPPEPRAVFVPSLMDAWVAVSSRKEAKGELAAVPLAEITGAWLEPITATPRGDVHFELEGAPGVLGYQVLVPGLLRRLELEILGAPEQLGALRMVLGRERHQEDAKAERRPSGALPEIAATGAFLEARAKLFAELREQHVRRIRKADEKAKVEPAVLAGIVETADLLACSGAIEEYARRYLSLVDALGETEGSAGAASYRTLAQLDVVELRWTKSAGDPGRALLLGPTHPVRLLWHLQHAAVCAEAVRELREDTADVPSKAAFFTQLRGELMPVNLPMVLFDDRGRGYVEQAPLSLHWSLYLPDRADGEKDVDAAICRDRVRRLLGLRQRSAILGAAASRHLATRIIEFLAQHPYCDEICFNVFNPGSGELVAELLRELEGARLLLGRGGEAPPLRYAVQMFGPPESLESMGEALEALLDPDRQVSEEDEFTLMSSNHLLPKLVFARNPIEKFVQNPGDFTAHVSIFLEQFAVRSQVTSIDRLRRSTHVKGLVHESESAQEQEGLYGWFRGVRPTPSARADARERLIVDALAATQRVHASAPSGRVEPAGYAPGVALHLEPQAQALLKHVHDVSDWVLTVDRNLGLDYFDSVSSARECGYLLDFAPEFLQEDRHRILLTTRSTLELQALVKPNFDRYGLVWEPGDELVALESLRSLSGRLALRLLASPNHAAEVVSLLLTRWLLEEAGLLEDRVVLPLDAHRNWFAVEDDAEVLQGVRGHRRADLLLISLDPRLRRIGLSIVEVKMRDDLAPSGRAHLYTKMREQSESTLRRLRTLFDRDLYPKPRADAALRAKELSAVLSFYTRRARRYLLIGDDEAEAALRFVEDLDAGYTLDLSMRGVFFDQRSTGRHQDEEDLGYVVDRFGLDKANELLVRARAQHAARLAAMSERAGAASSPSVSSEPREPWLESVRSAYGGRTMLAPRREEPTPSARAVLTAIAGRELTPAAPAAAPVVEAPAASSLAPVVAPVFPIGPPPREYPVAGQPAQLFAAERTATTAVSPEPAVSAEHAASPEAALAVDALLGATEMTAQYGVLGRAGSATVGLDLMGCNTISLFGVQGFGKSYTLGVIGEMATTAVAGINVLPSPLATVVFHYHKSDAYAPEFAAATQPNQKPREIERLLKEYGARPQGLRDVVLLSPEGKVEQRRRDFPGIEVHPIKFGSSEIGSDGWKFLLGAAGNDSLYIKQLVAIMRRYRNGLTVETLRRELAATNLSDAVRRLAEDRVNLAEPYIDDSVSLASLLRPGRTIIVDLRDEWIEKEEALGLFVVMMRIFAMSRHEGREFNKLMVFDEAHKYITESELIGQVVETIREMRHQATSVLIASQDPLSVPRAVIELTSVLVLHRMTSPQWLKHLKGAISALEGLTEAHLAALEPGEALVWAQRSTDKRFTQRPVKVVMRPRFTQHGGGTKTAVSGRTVR